MKCRNWPLGLGILLVLFTLLGLPAKSWSSPNKIAIILAIDDVSFAVRTRNAVSTLQRLGWKVHVFSGDLSLNIGIPKNSPFFHQISKQNLSEVGISSAFLSVIGRANPLPDDKVLFHILTHGYLCQTSRLQCLHAAGKSFLEIRGEWIQSAIAKAKTTRAKVAVVNTSCHSGSWLEQPWDQNSCLTASTTREGNSNNGFDIFQGAEAGDSLSKVFSQTLGRANHSFSPQISMALRIPGIQILRRLTWIHDNITPVDELRIAYDLSLKLGSNKDSTSLEDQIDRWLEEKIDAPARELKTTPEAEPILLSLESYRKNLRAYLLESMKVIVPNLTLISSKRISELRRLVLPNGDRLDELYLSSLSPEDIKGLIAPLKFLEKRRAQKLLSEYAASSYQQRVRGYLAPLKEKKEKIIEPAAKKYLTDEHALYKTLVNQLSEKNTDACTEFRL